MQAFLAVNNMAFSIGEKRILSEINFQLGSGRIATLLGPSGCGKTTLLRLIAGFSPPGSGEIALDGRVISSPDGVLPPEKRDIGMVFQDYALFPHLSVFDNVAFGLKRAGKRADRRADKSAAEQRVQELLAMVGLSGYEKRHPHELSGGEQQRVAIARAIAPRPKLLLLDEPFASLDANLRERLVRDLGVLLKQLDITTILVTHDQREAFAVSDDIGLMQSGRILQWDKPFNIYHKPSAPFVANFVGSGVMVKATVIADNAVDSALGVVRSREPLVNSIGQKICVLVRPNDIVEDKQSPLRATIRHKFFHGANTQYELDFQGIKLVANINSHANYAVGDRVPFTVHSDSLVTFCNAEAHCVC